MQKLTLRKAQNMNTTVDQLRESLRTKMTKIEGQLGEIKSEIKMSAKEDKAAIQSKLKAAKMGVQSMSKNMKAAETKAGRWIKAKEKSGSSVIQGWKNKFEKTKLDRHANSAADNALAAVSIAEAKIANAVLATYEAIDARMAVDELNKGIISSRNGKGHLRKKMSQSKRM